MSNFDSHTVSVVDKATFAVETIATGRAAACALRVGRGRFRHHPRGEHAGEAHRRSLDEENPPRPTPDNLFPWGDKLVITSHDAAALYVTEFDPRTKSFALLHKESYPYGDTRFDTANVSFYVRGQFGDAVFAITRGKNRQGRKTVDHRLPIGETIHFGEMIPALPAARYSGPERPPRGREPA